MREAVVDQYCVVGVKISWLWRWRHFGVSAVVIHDLITSIPLLEYARLRF